MRTVTITEGRISSTLDIYEFGSGSGPKLIFTGGIHGNEFGGINVAERLVDFFTQNPPIWGRITVIPWCNPTASRCMQRRSPFDEEDMNRIFPGDSQKSISHRVAAAIWQETADADYIVDLHCCGQHGTPYILATYKEHEKARTLAGLITEIPIVIRSAGTPGQLFTNSCRDRGQAALIIEIPSGPSSGSINIESTDMVYAGLMDMLRSMGFIEGTAKGKAPAFYDALCDADMPHGGFWVPASQSRISVGRGHVLGHVDGTPVEMPEDGYITAMRPKGYVYADNLWAAIYAPPEQ